MKLLRIELVVGLTTTAKESESGFDLLSKQCLKEYISMPFGASYNDNFNI